MAEKIKKGFFKVLPWSVVILLIFATAVGLYFDQPAPVARAAVGNTTALSLYDTNGNGKIDQIQLSIDNPLATTWTAGAAGSSVTASGAGVTISSVALASANNANPLLVNINLDEIDTDLVWNTDGVTSGPIEYIYVQQGLLGGGITDGIMEMNAIATGDTGATDTEIDKAAPVALTTGVVYKDITVVNGTVDRVDIQFSESITLNEYDDADWSFPVPGDITLTNESAAAVFGNVIRLTVAGDANETGGAVSPTVSYSAAGGTANSVRDNAITPNNAASFGPATVLDAAAPVVTARETADASGPNGKIDRIIVTTTENLDDDDAGLTTTVGTYGGETFNAGAVGNDNIFWIDFTENAGNCMGGDQAGCDTDATPTVTISANTSLSDSTGNNIATDAGVAATDKALPIFIATAYMSFGTEPSSPGAANVGGGDSDAVAGDAIQSLTNCAVTIGGAANQYDNGEDVYIDNDASNTVTTGDRRITNAYQTYDIGSIVSCPGDTGCGNALQTLTQCKVTGGNALWTPGVEHVYDDLDADGFVSAGDSRIYYPETPGNTVNVLLILYSEPVTYAASGILYDDSEWTATVNGLTGFDVSGCLFGGAGCAGALGGFEGLALDVSGTSANQTGVSGGVEPQIAYAYSTQRIQDLAAAPNYAADLPATSIFDVAKPVLVSAEYLDNTSDGTVDTIRTTWSENVTMAGSTTDDWTITGGSINAAFSSAPVDASAGTTLDILVTADAGETSGVVAPTISYNNGDKNNSVIDDSTQSNEAEATPTPAGSPSPVITVADGAKPAFLSALTLDSNFDGTVDHLAMTFSEPVTVTDGGTDDDITLTASSGTATVDAGVYGAVGTTTLTYNITVSATGNTAITIDPTYATAGAGSISDTVNEMANAETVTGADGAKPAILSALTSDANSDGTVDRLVLTLSESSDVIDGNAGDGFPAIALVASSGTATIDNANYAGTASTVFNFNITVSATGNTAITVTPTYSTAPAGTIQDRAAAPNEMANGETVAGADAAAPVILTTSPANGATSVALSANYVVTFSEPMNTGTVAYTPTPNPGGFAVVWSVGNTVATYSHTAFLVFTGYTFNVTAGNAAAGAPAGLVAGPVANPFSFTTTGGSGGGGGGGGGGYVAGSLVINGNTETTSNPIVTLTLTGTNAAQMIIGNDSNFIGDSWETFATSKTWTLPSGDGLKTVYAKFKDSANNLSQTASDTITLNVTTGVSAANSTIAASPTTVAADGATYSTITVTAKNGTGELLSGKTVTVSSSRGASDTINAVAGTTGADGKATFHAVSSTAGTSTYVATVDGVVITSTASIVFASTAPETPGTPPEELPVPLQVGDLIKSDLSTSVYYYGSDNKRHLFPNEKTYKSWYTDWSGIKAVPASELQGISLGHNVTIRPGTVLVKIETDPKVYAVEPNGLLRWVPNEARATTLYGADWAKKIIDVPMIFWGDYAFGADITTDTHPTGTLVKYSSSANVYYISGATKRLIATESAFNANRFRDVYILTIPATIVYTNGADITASEQAIVQIY